MLILIATLQFFHCIVWECFLKLNNSEYVHVDIIIYFEFVRQYQNIFKLNIYECYQRKLQNLSRCVLLALCISCGFHMLFTGIFHPWGIIGLVQPKMPKNMCIILNYMYHQEHGRLKPTPFLIYPGISLAWAPFPAHVIVLYISKTILHVHFC